MIARRDPGSGTTRTGRARVFTQPGKRRGDVRRGRAVSQSTSSGGVAELDAAEPASCPRTPEPYSPACALVSVARPSQNRPSQLRTKFFAENAFLYPRYASRTIGQVE